MALARFFGRASLAASQVLRGFDPEEFEKALNERVVGVFFDDDAATSPEGRACLALATNLLARFYPRIAIVAEGAAAGELVESLVSGVRAINPEISIEPTLEGAAACLVVGSTEVTVECPAVYVGSDGWLARVSSRTPVDLGTTTNPFRAGAAACFGVANVFRALFGAQLPSSDLDDFSMSLLDLDPSAPASPGPELEQTDLGDSYLVGPGAVGNGAVWALSRLPEARGV
ncbi:MAG: E2 ligase fold family C protein, partial [Rubrobacter sp.]